MDLEQIIVHKIFDKIQESSKEGQILIGSNTYEQIKDKIDVIKSDQITVPGRHHPITVYELKGIKEQQKN